MAGRRLRRITAILVVAAGLAVIGALASGEVALVTTHGVSMEPSFHTGDLAVIVPSASYHVGEVVGYHSPLLHIVVLHRIVAEHGGLFTYKGDNNNFLDPVRTPASAIEGRLWLHIARGGTVLGWLRSPVVLGVLAFLMIAFGAGGVTRRRARGPGGAGSRPKPERAAPGAVGVGWWPVATVSALVAIFALVTLVAWVSPPTRPSVRAVPYEQKVGFSYAATAAKGVTYPTGTVTTGDPVFLQLVHALDVGVHYALRSTSSSRSGPAPTLSGTVAATATLEGPGGWTAPLAALPTVSFSGPAATIEVPLDLTRIPALESAFTFETGVALDNPEIVLTPVLHLHGTLDDEPFGGVLAPSLSFRVDGSLLDVIGTSASRGGESTSAMSVRRSGSVEEHTLVPARLSLLGRSIAVTRARRLGLVGLVVALLAAVGGFIWWTRRRRMDETTRIHAAYSHDLVAVSASPTAKAPLVVDVATFEELARLARRYDCVILEHSHDAGHAYYVESGTTLYRCGVEPEAPALVAAGHTAASPAVEHTVAAGGITGPMSRRRLRSVSAAADDDRARIADDVDLLTCLARAELVSGVGDARSHLREAIILARKAALDGSMIDALVINARPCFDRGQEGDPEKIELLQYALGLPGDSPARRARLLGALAVESIFVRDGTERGLLLDEARQLALQSGDARSLIDVAAGTFLARPRQSWSRRRFDNDRALVNQARDAAVALGDPVDRATTQSHAAFCALIAGDGPALRQDLAALGQTAAGGQNQVARHGELLLAQNIATLEGRLADAEELSLDVSDADGRPAAPVSEADRAVSQIALRREQDRLAELIPALSQDDDEAEPASLPRAARAFVLAETGTGDEAAMLLHRAEAAGWSGLPDDLHWSTAVALWSEVAARIGDRHAAAALHQILVPHDGTELGSGPVGCGPAARLLALLASLLGQTDEADRHWAQAVAFSRELMSPVWVARCQLEWAEILFERGEAPSAARLTDEADAAAGDLALPALGRQWTALQDRLDPGGF